MRRQEMYIEVLVNVQGERDYIKYTEMEKHQLAIISVETSLNSKAS
jgi:uncharacterized protein YueI